MEYTILTGTSLKVSKLSLGTMTFGGQVSEAEAIKLSHRAFDAGIHFVDTANCYAQGMSEQIVGKAIKGRRGRIILATKVGTPYQNAYGKVEGGFSRNDVIKELETSLKRLQTDYIDLYYLHLPDYKTPLAEVIYTFSRLIQEGKIRHIGISNYAAWQVCQMHHECQIRNLEGPVVTQMVYNLITRGIEQEFIPFLKEYQMGMVVYNPLAAGILSGKYTDRKKVENTRFYLEQKYAERYWNDDSFEAVAKLKSIASDADMTLTELALCWCLSNHAVDSVILGFTKSEHLEENIHSGSKGSLTEDILDACNVVWNDLKGSRFQYNR